MRSGDSTTSPQGGVAAWLTDPERRAALIVAHPAHEIRVLHWLRATRPHVYILTQGSRSGADSTRREASERLIRSLGASVSRWGGVWDRDLYAMLLEGVHAPLLDLAEALAADLVRREIDLVVADPWQYYNVAHDLTYLMAHLATCRAADALGRDIRLLTFPVVPESLARGAPAMPIVATLELGAAASAAKRASIDSTPDVGFEAAIIEHVEGREAHAREWFLEPPALGDLLEPPREPPLYEIFGEGRVGLQVYADVIRWKHMERVCRALVGAWRR